MAPARCGRHAFRSTREPLAAPLPTLAGKLIALPIRPNLEDEDVRIAMNTLHSPRLTSPHRPGSARRREHDEGHDSEALVLDACGALG